MKLTPLERSWALYDVGNSAFVLMVSTIMPIYFKNLTSAAGVADYNSTAWWSYAVAISTLLAALLGPTLGNLADKRGWKRGLYALFVVGGAITCALLGFSPTWLIFLAVFVVAKVFFSTSLVFYDSMLPDVTTAERVDMVSSTGYAWGYLGSCIPFVACLVLVLTAEQTGIGTMRAIILAFLITAVWWAVLSVPLYGRYRQTHRNTGELAGMRELGQVVWEIIQHKKIRLYLLAYFFYIDGVFTIIEMATSYGKDVGIGDTDLVLALLLTQVVAFPFAILFGRLAGKFATESLLQICIAGYFFIAVFALQLDKAWEFWFLAVCVAVFQGAIQALSRSYFARIIPAEKSGAYFGFYDIFGKGASFFGAVVLGVATQIFSTSRAGVVALALLFPLGLWLLRKSMKIPVKM